MLLIYTGKLAKVPASQATRDSKLAPFPDDRLKTELKKSIGVFQATTLVWRPLSVILDTWKLLLFTIEGEKVESKGNLAA